MVSQEEKFVIEVMMFGINRFLFHNWNFESKRNPADCRDYPRVILEAGWDCNLEHICAKWRRFADEDGVCEGNTDWAFVKFYGELDTENRKAMLLWILTHYEDEPKLVEP